ncbi:MAG: amidophosphoribosyltransferase [Thermodesulfovibrio sp.]|uniref:amidophosphoribosyltransferase n=1 Tax=Thermodesulfovibrio sp. N1 TaxID=1871110 RepID=UPI000839DCEA|nr:amidophosphoribosyltransferase [Thermodesulfovibrio sp. N1]MDI6714286.1 amidophosphoribosyltransferase [Thermodesulfovibrio sp.]ODA44652.1 Amidophosphoribosyltransferase [Thermodesulfovibrio sp. N1]
MNKTLFLPEIHEECGIFGIFGHSEAANLTYLGLYALQHRGQEGAGICSSDGTKLYLEKSLGLVAEIFNEKVLKNLPGHIAIGHNRYSTTGASTIENVQPLMATYSLGSIAIAHNGNLVDIENLKNKLEKDGAIFQSTSDSEIILHLIARAKSGEPKERIASAVRQISGAFSLLLMTEKELIAIRDPYGIRPLCLGQIKDAYVVASETCAFDLIGATYLRDIEPGEMLIIDENGLNSMKIFNSIKRAHCVFEFIYFARPDSYIFDHICVHTIRKELGRQLAREHAIDADLVIPVPDSGVPAALGYAEESGIPFEFGLIRNHYVGRTFIEPKQSIRHFGVKVKLNPVRDALKGKKVVVIDDSIVRGTTSKKIVKMIRELGGAKEVHLRISSPPTIGPCFYGIDTPTRQELIASSHKIEEIRKYTTADSLSYLSIEGLKKIVPNSDLYCMACFNCKYPIEFQSKKINQLELFE